MPEIKKPFDYRPKPIGDHYDPYFANYGVDSKGKVNDFGKKYMEWTATYGKDAYVDWSGY